ncbi:MAG: helix-turn-helix domain-containing protein [Polyangiaceae bacterium]
MRLLTAQRWEGNVRELENAIEHAVVFCRDATISPGDLPFSKKPSGTQEPPPELVSTAGPSLDPLVDLPYREAKDRAVHAFESSYFNALLQRSGGNVSEAARQAGLDRSNFRRAAKRAGVRMRDEGG